MDLSTEYLGLKLRTPLVIGASPMVDDLDQVKRLTEAGASAIVMHSLFEEQLSQEAEAHADMATHGESYAEASSFLPGPSDYLLGPDAYLRQIGRVKEASGLPVIASLNGVSPGGWLHYAKLMEEAGANALEINAYTVPTDPEITGEDLENDLVSMVKKLHAETKLPLAVKLSPYITSLPNLAARLSDAGASGLVLFNRFYEPEIAVEDLEGHSTLYLSTSAELPLRLRWLGVLFGQVKASLAVSGGVHDAMDALKSVMTGASCVQLVSAIFKLGPGVITQIEKGLVNWLEEHEYESLSQAHGSMSRDRTPNPEVFERGNYIKLLQGYTRR